ncbi:bifunctional adenosylcobinamide kinase/adenosylcobinamide-phosphate guanylyltransferase [Larsenimonas suaedae]|uniref:Bifunctional adenosylcobalamin biosynthesis protein n=1 Tax=Larsenimonas suaedae TaxID=1851019 RepID=A0ABU1GXM5_9GAMM|nr:bifunctional adenosylcobinamide kinase/adenosylcobinamide-phosphate guanylyltransferase [Larsenimonas suaedae]MCM2971533.1 bifunctional adenosylcobinamide kinase/adenosylcobinamide-phosphate guanylyltransferase [Larsenimonas suaedae]MDR5896789.1 bifunctional adenosylcobinamide kinase/adenosylcobinamide-phosphate guanylyltransferase [Larsenimonas suaedae]
MVELILGGARSGKSRFAETLAQYSMHRENEVIYVATAQAGDDTSMRERIELHRARRPEGWGLIESPLDLPETLSRAMAPGRCVLVDCLTLWLTNELLRERDMTAALEALDDVLAHAEGRILIVSNEVGQGVVPMNALSRRFVDLSGTAHQRIAQRASHAWWVVAGLPQCLKGVPMPALGHPEGT